MGQGRYMVKLSKKMGSPPAGLQVKLALFLIASRQWRPYYGVHKGGGGTFGGLEGEYFWGAGARGNWWLPSVWPSEFLRCFWNQVPKSGPVDSECTDL